MYTKTVWKNEPSTDTPITAEALNNMENAIEDVDKRVTELEEGGGGSDDTKMNVENPTGTGSFSMNRKADTTVGDYSTAEGYGCEASGNYSHAEGGTHTWYREYDDSYQISPSPKATSENSHAEGAGTEATGMVSHAEGLGSVASGDYSHAEGRFSVASGENSHAEGVGTASGSLSHAEGGGIASGHEAHAEASSEASGMFSHSEGSGTASGKYSHAEGIGAKASGEYSHAEGEGCHASGKASHAEGSGAKAKEAYSHAEGIGTIASINQHVQGHYNNITTAGSNSMVGTSDGSAFVIGNGLSGSASNAFRVTGNGEIYAQSSTISTGADYAEYFEWADENPNAEDRVGYFVTFDEENEEKLRIANEGEYILGIISGLPSVIGNGDEDWKQRFITDEFGRYITEEFEYTVEERSIDENGEEVVTEVIMTGTHWKENPDYDKSKEYVPRKLRKEWSAVGMLGVLSVRDDGTCKVNGYCKCADNGIATACERGTDTYRVIKRVTDNVVKVVLK